MERKKVDEWALCERGTEIKGKAEIIAATLEATFINSNKDTIDKLDFHGGRLLGLQVSKTLRGCSNPNLCLLNPLLSSQPPHV